jgi:hypothetical protein
MYAEPLKTKTGAAVQKAFKQIFSKFHSPVIKLETDQVIFFTFELMLFVMEKIKVFL